jgi:hypothetical protein
MSAGPRIFAILRFSNQVSGGLSRRMSRLVLLDYDPARYIITVFLRLDTGIPVGSREIRNISPPLKSLQYLWIDLSWALPNGQNWEQFMCFDASSSQPYLHSAMSNHSPHI